MILGRDIYDGPPYLALALAECDALDKAESLARGAALKWASGIFCRPDQLAHLAQYRRRETQRNNSIQSRMKVSVPILHTPQSSLLLVMSCKVHMERVSIIAS